MLEQLSSPLIWNLQGIFSNSGWLKHPSFLISIDRHSLKKLMLKFQLAVILHGEIYRITWNILHFCILYYNFWCPGIRNSQMQRSTCFVKTGLFLQKSLWSEVIVGEFFLNMPISTYGKKCTPDKRLSEYPFKTFCHAC